VLGIVVGAGVLPLGLVGLWLAYTSVRSGEALLEDELDLMLDRIAAGVEERWDIRRGNLLLLAHNAEVVNALLGPRSAVRDDSVRAYLSDVYQSMRARLPLVRITDESGALRWQLEDSVPVARDREGQSIAGIAPDPPMSVREAIVEEGRRLGELEAQIRFASLLPADSAARQVANASVSITAADGGLLYSTSDASLEVEDVVRVRRVLERPAVTIEVAAPSAPYTAPFRRAAALGTTALALCAVVSLLLTAFLSRRLTRPLSELAEAADAVARGRLEQRVDPEGPDEVRRLSAGFNAMTENLQATLEAMAKQKSLADVGEFAAELAHEVRNALTAVRVNVQRAQKRIGTNPAAELLSQTLEHVDHLDRVVTGALHVARSGRVGSAPVELACVLTASERAVADKLARAEVRLNRRDSLPAARVNGDASALQLLFTNLMLNAGEASPTGGVVEVAVSADGHHVVVEVRDEGKGIPGDQLAQVWEPLYSTKPDGTGLGLPIALQIAKAHGGTLTLENGQVSGVVSRVRLPLV
jgi:signal transduction histidine kinase